MINGLDNLSQTIVKLIDKGYSLKDIAEDMNVSYNQVKKLSRYFKMQQLLKDKVSETALKKFEQLGLKALALVKFFDNEQWDGLEDTLNSITSEIRRIDLEKLYAAYLEKRAEIEDKKRYAQNRIYVLKEKEKQIQAEIVKLQTDQNTISEVVKEFKKYSTQEQDFLLDHVGMATISVFEGNGYMNFKTEKYEDGKVVTTTKNVLIKRLDYNWQRNLKAAEIVVYDDNNYVWIIPDVNNFVEAYRKRIKNRGRIEYDHRNTPKNSPYYYPEDPYYYSSKIASLNESLRDKIKSHKSKIKELESEKFKIEEEIKEIKKMDVTTFINRVEISNTISSKEIKEHGRLQQLGLKYLFEREHVAAAEVTYKTYR